MRKYLKPDDCSGLTQLDIPEWDKFEFMLTLSSTSLFLTAPSLIKWWLTMTCVIFFLYMVDWRFHFIDWINYRRVVIKEEMDAALFKQHLCHFSQATGTPFSINPLLSTLGCSMRKDTIRNQT
eukprot:12586816-Ditylum_brightwellii.AAC.1